MKNYKQTASDVLRLVGGEKNVVQVEHCSTRLRFTLADTSKADAAALKKTAGVMGVISSGPQCQVVIGNDVIEVYDELLKLGTFNAGQAAAPAAPKGKKEIGGIILDYMVGIFQPLVPAIAGAGVLKALMVLLSTLGLMSSGDIAYKVFVGVADALKKEMIRVIQGISGLDREMIQQMVNENKEALLIAQTNLADSEKKLKEIEEQNQKAERNCSDLFTWASTYKGASFERRQAILKQFIKEVRVGRDYNIEIVLNVPLDEFEEFKRHAASAGRGKNQKNKSQNPQKVGRCTSNAGIVVLDKTAGETISIVPKNAAHAILRC